MKHTIAVRKKPVTVHAFQLTRALLDATPKHHAVIVDGKATKVFKQGDDHGSIETLEGTMHASIGDWIVTGVRGENYPVKPDIFEDTYERLEVSTEGLRKVLGKGLKCDDRVKRVRIAGVIKTSLVRHECTDPKLKGECSGCTDPHSEGTHQGCTKQHGHVGCNKAKTSGWPMKKRRKVRRI